MKDRITKILREMPGLTGKQISKKLGDVTKSEVNSFLYNNPEGFIQDDNWKWYLDEDVYSLEFRSNSWINERYFEEDLANAGGMLETEHSKCVMRFPAKCKILLIAGARIVALANQAVYLGKDVELDFTKCPNTKHYLDRLGFFDHLLPSISVLPARPENSKAELYRGNSDALVEIASIDLDQFDYSLPEKLTKQFAKHAGQEYYGAAFTIFSELIGNVQEHSETPLPGFVALQLYKGKRRHVQTVISDSGLGIADTLKRNLKKHYPEIFEKLDLSNIESDIYLVKQALTEGGLSQFGSDPDEAARGLGLSRTQSYAAKYDAEVTVRQMTFELKLIYKNGNLDQVKNKKGLPMIKGTQVCFDFFLDKA